MHQLSARDRLLLALLTLFWGLNWPIMKLGVTRFPPLTFRVVSMLGGLVFMYAILRARRMPLAIPRGKFGVICMITAPGMLVWHVLMIIGVRMLSSGRAAILGYTMPVWAMLFGYFLYRERVAALSWLGVASAMAGAGLLLSSEITLLTGQPLGAALALIAAAAWGLGTVLIRRHPLEMPTLSLTFWMVLLTAAAMIAPAVVFEHAQWRLPDTAESLSLLFNAVITFGVCHVIWFDLARKLPPVASGLAVMLIPAVGVFSGALMLGEVPHWQDYLAIVFLMLALASVVFQRPAAPIEPE